MPNFLPHARNTLIAFTGLAGVLTVLHAWELPPFRGTVETTENAYVRGQVTVISPQLAGYVTHVAVHDFQTVKTGDLLIQIDERIYEQRLRQARATLIVQRANLANAEQTQHSAEARIKAGEAQVEGARATLNAAEATESRISALLERGISTRAAADQATAALGQARAALQAAESTLMVARQDLLTVLTNRDSFAAAVENADAAVRLAEIDLQNTRIVAPRDGRLGEIGVRLGQYVAAGTQLAALVPEQRWVVANFKEDQLPHMAIGQPATFSVDALQGSSLRGHIEDFSPATGSEFSVIRADNATGNFTKVAQRLPVRIAIDEGQEDAARLAPGMSVVVSVDTAAKPEAQQITHLR